MVDAGKVGTRDENNDGVRNAISTSVFYSTVPSLYNTLRVCYNHLQAYIVGTMTASTTEASSFPIPSSLQDLEREPYNLLPYPHDFDDDDEAARADSFGRLVELIDQGNQLLLSEGILLFQTYEGQVPWLQTDRVQALYTLVRYEN